MNQSIASLLLGAGLLALSAAAVAGTGVSINLGEPGFYGRIDIGDAPPPRVVYAEPVIVERAPRYMEQAPVYLRVPAGYQRDWRRHCGAYRACGQRVFFVQDTWYRNEYAPHYREHHGGPREWRDAPHHRPDNRPHGEPRNRDDHGGRPDRHDDRRDHHEERRDDHGGGRDGRPGNDHRNQ